MASSNDAPKAADAGIPRADLGVDLNEHAARIGRQDRVATGILTVIVAFVLALLAAIVAFILFQGLGRALSPGFLTTSPLAEENPGISSELFDSFYMLVITLLISVPVSLGAAIFLVEYAPDNWVTKAASTAIETLSSLPSIVVGMFGSLFFVVTLGWGISILAGAMALTMFNIPILVRVIQQALEDVPQSQRDAGLAMGLTRWETTVHVLLPAAMPAIVNINFASMNLASPRNPWNVFRPAETLAVHIWKLKMEPSPGNDQIVWGTAAVLLICVLLFNVVARLLGRALAKKMTSE